MAIPSVGYFALWPNFRCTCTSSLEPTSFLQIRPIIDKGQPIFLHLRAFGDKGPIIFTDKAFLQIRASQVYDDQ